MSVVIVKDSPTDEVVASKSAPGDLPARSVAPDPKFPYYIIKQGNTQVKVATLGAQMFSFNHAGEEYLHVCDKADTTGNTAFRGGDQICAPMFGNGAVNRALGVEVDPDMPMHGYFRNAIWRTDGPIHDPSGEFQTITLKLSSDDVLDPKVLCGCSFEAVITHKIYDGKKRHFLK